MKGTRILALVLAALLLVGIVPAAVAEDEPVHISVAGYMFGPIDNDRDVITPLVEQQLKESTASMWTSKWSTLSRRTIPRS